jgi:hypothetical protein
MLPQLAKTMTDNREPLLKPMYNGTNDAELRGKLPGILRANAALFNI